MAMGVGAYRAERTKRALPTTLSFYLCVLLATSSSGINALHDRKPTGDVRDLFSGNTVSLDSIGSPVASAAERANEALDDENFVNPSDRPRELPVWPPPSATVPVDPASNGMIGAPPMRVDWPYPSASGAKSPASLPRKH
jgi:hypothetical protein